MKIIARTGNKDIASVYIAELGNNKLVEFVESVQPPIPMDKKWVLIISTLFGCPVKCRFCDAGGFYSGRLSKNQMLDQIDYLVLKYFPDRIIPVEKFKIQFARMGEPAFNPAVLDVLEDFPAIYSAPGFMPSVSTIAPSGTDEFFERLLDIKNRFYQGRFQMQFSLHTTDERKRDWLVPAKKWDFARIAEYGERFFSDGDRKITLNFALAEDSEVNPARLLRHFDPEKFLIKITPVNPTYSSVDNGVNSGININNRADEVISSLENAGYDVLLSIGELEENEIGSNCGQHIMNYMNKDKKIKNSYTYEVETCIKGNCSVDKDEINTGVQEFA